MSDKIKSFEEFETRLNKEAIPYNPALPQAILTQQKQPKPFYLRFSVIAIFLSLFVAGGATTAMQYTGLKLFNGDGKQVYEINSFDEEMLEDTRKFDDYYAQYRGMLENKRKHIPHGKFVYFLPVEGYEKLGTTMLIATWGTNEINSISELSPSFLDSLNLMDEGLFGKYTLTEGTVNYKLPEFNAEELAEELYQEAKKANKEFIFKDGALSNEIDSVSLSYESDNSMYRFYFENTGKQMSTNEDLSFYKKITYKGVDFLFNPTKNWLRTVKESDSGNILIDISTMVAIGEEFDPLEEMIPLAYSIMYK